MTTNVELAVLVNTSGGTAIVFAQLNHHLFAKMETIVCITGIVARMVSVIKRKVSSSLGIELSSFIYEILIIFTKHLIRHTFQRVCLQHS